MSGAATHLRNLDKITKVRKASNYEPLAFWDWASVFNQRPHTILLRNRTFRSEPFRSGRFGHGTFRSDYEILQKSYSIALLSRLIQSALPPSSYCRLPKVKAFHSKRVPFTIRNSGKRCRQGILLGIKFLVVERNWISGVSGLSRVFHYDL